jgi:hypothetical protein
MFLIDFFTPPEPTKRVYPPFHRVLTMATTTPARAEQLKKSLRFIVFCLYEGPFQELT